jgi:hypothetical protein
MEQQVSRGYKVALVLQGLLDLQVHHKGHQGLLVLLVLLDQQALEVLLVQRVHKVLPV